MCALTTGFSDQAVALTHRGAAALADGQEALADCCFTAAAILAPHRASIWHNLGEARRIQGRVEDAEQAYKHALRLRPAYPKAWAGLASLLHKTRRFKAAARAAMRALALDPGFAEGWSIAGSILHERRAMERLPMIFLRAVRLAPTSPSAWLALAGGLGEAAELALACTQRSVALSPDRPGGYVSHAGLLIRHGKLDAAQAMHDRLRQLAPLEGHAEAGDSLVASLRGDFATAVSLGRRSLALQPASLSALINLSLAEHDSGQMERARRGNERALALHPESDVARFNLSMVLLAQGDFANGWRLYESRWRMENRAYPAHAPRWRGGDPAGRSFLLVAEQGQGDTLHFVRYAPMLAALGAHVHLMVQPSLVRLLSTLPGIASVRSLADPPPVCDACIPLLSLPLAFGTTLATIPAAVPYLHTSEQDRATWKRRLGGERRRRVGLVWAGSAHDEQFIAHMVDRRRSFPLAALAPLADVPGVTFYSLQKGPPANEVRPPGLDLVDWMEMVGDFADTAAFVAELDLVISVDTSVCHLVGALGRPIWMLSRYDSCWRWLCNRSDSPWYPTMRLFRQGRPGDWTPVIDRVRIALERWAMRGPCSTYEA
ncbi:tetratricopeptide repeat protein [Azospirillum sp. Sh1]|uniref:tetratricopeptide repeat protein n=1 Tax=Azospirillum sp. Sh1 TaxID=2607285 RepID=UPI0011EDD1C4|nr:tetratricopeptide repeat protein [Azospirillum sp. Sh1]KAA0571894.1 tetratricopeptide repeat protein [Azospirillum sp. Sh1]